MSQTPAQALELRLEAPGGVLPYESPLTFRWSGSEPVGSYVIRLLSGPPGDRKELWTSSRLGSDQRSLSIPLPFASEPEGQLVWVLEAYWEGKLVAQGARVFSFKPARNRFISWLEQISELRNPPSVLYAPHGRIAPGSEIEFAWSHTEDPHHFVIRVLEERLDSEALEPQEVWVSEDISGQQRKHRAKLALADAATSRYFWTLDVYRKAGQRASRTEAQSFSVLTNAELEALRQRDRLFAAWEAQGGERHLLLLRAADAAAREGYGEARRSLSQFLSLQDDRGLSFKALTTLVARELQKVAVERERLTESYDATVAGTKRNEILARLGEANLLLLDYDGALACYRALRDGTQGSERDRLESRIAQLLQEQESLRSIFLEPLPIQAGSKEKETAQ